MKQSTGGAHPVTLQDRVRAGVRGVVEGAAGVLVVWGVSPDAITLAGTAGVVGAALLIGVGALTPAGVVLLLMLPLDALDGAVARLMRRKDRRGAVLDSTMDRLADGALMSAIAYYFAAQDALHYTALALAALVGGFVVSYVRARAGEAGLAVRVGLLDRLVRTVVLLVALLVPVVLIPALWVLAVGSWITVVQRLLYVYNHLDREDAHGVSTRIH